MCQTGYRIIRLKRKYALFYATYCAIRGYRIIKKLHKLYGKETHIIFMRGATGDTYIQMMFLDEYIKQKGVEKYILIGDAKGVKGLRRVFCIPRYLEYPTPIADCIEKAVLFFNGNELNVRMFFNWSYGMNIFNRCRIRMTEKFTFLDTYKYFALELEGDINYRVPVFSDNSERDEFRWIKQGIVKGKTVIISPDANSVTHLPVWFWNVIIKELQKWDYIVLVNCDYQNDYRAADIFFSYEDSVPLLNYAGFFLGIRSGLCDIISTSGCKKVILYPEKQEIVDYSEHRSEKEFSSLKLMKMGSDNKEDTNLVEISTRLLRNITDEDMMISGGDDYVRELQLLKSDILNYFLKGKENANS